MELHNRKPNKTTSFRDDNPAPAPAAIPPAPAGNQPQQQRRRLSLALIALCIRAFQDLYLHKRTYVRSPSNVAVDISNDQDTLAALVGKSNVESNATRRFFSCVLEALKNTTMRLLLLCALLLLGFGLKAHVPGPKHGWYDGASIFMAVFLVVSISALINFKVSHVHGEKTPIQGQLKKINLYISLLALLVASLLLVVRFILYFTGYTKDENGNKEFNGINIVYAALTIVVVALPVGLPLTTSLTMAYSMKKMRAANAIMRKLSACEIMGSATAICAEKTGTLTLNEMEVAEFRLGKQVAENPQDLAEDVIDLLKQAAGLNSTRSNCHSSSESVPQVPSVNSTEKALLSWAESHLGMDETDTTRFEILHVEPFDSRKKRSGVMVRERRENKLQLHWKGAAEIILAMCCNFYDRRGKLESIDNKDRKKFKKVTQRMAKKGLRCIAFAHKNIQHEHNDGNKLDESGLSLLGIVGLKDPSRPGVQEVVESWREAGVDVKIVTGDHILTAKAIAVECGILAKDKSHDEALIEAKKFRDYSPEEQMEKIDHIQVMARSSPSDKLLMAECLKRKGHVVAFIGNDVAAFKEADISLSMYNGNEIAKESSDIVILNNRLESIIKILRCGRQVYSNIQEFVKFQLTVNTVAVVINSIALFSSGIARLTVFEWLWLNLIITALGAVSLLSTEQSSTANDDGLMKKNPDRRAVVPLNIITEDMWKSLIKQTWYQIMIMVTLQYKGNSNFDVIDQVFDTMFFNIFVLLQVFNELNAWKNKDIFEGISSGIIFLVGICIIILMQVTIVQLKFAGIEKLNLDQWLKCLITSAGPLVPSAIFQFFN